MGQKSSPVGLRLQINRTWDSRWFAEGQDYGRLLLEDLQIRKYILKFSPKGMSEDVYKVLASAVANAENNHNLDVDALIVAEASVGKSISMKRFMTRARGRSSRIVKPFSRLRVVVREQEEA